MKRKQSQSLKTILLILLCIVTPFIILFGLWLNNLDNEVRENLQQNWFTPPVMIYSHPKVIAHGLPGNIVELKQHFSLLHFSEVSPEVRLTKGQMSLWPLNKCQAHLNQDLPEETQDCLVFIYKNTHHLVMITTSTEGVINGLYSGEPLTPIEKFEFEPYLFAQYYGEKPILRRLVKIANIPLYCAQAVLAIEDKNFLLHRGFSPMGFLRAAIANVLAGRFAQGGSTITQQLVKNYFLSPEKTIQRKIKEIFIALILESRVEKEVILENYLNVNYMGQNGPFEVRGFGAASRHYFNQELEELDLPQCSLLAAIVNNPGRFNPFRHPDLAKNRREKVLRHMVEQNLIDEGSFTMANKQPLPEKPPTILSEPAPYYVQGVFAELAKLNFDQDRQEQGLKIYTYLNPEAQELARKAVDQGIQQALKGSKKLTEIDRVKTLQGLLVSADLKSGGIQALMGGRSYRNSQFNRVLNGRRQVGSIMKPFVYLTALENLTSNGNPYTPLTIINDEKFTYEYEGQTWTPQNYEKKFFGPIPMFYALKNSINVATARLGLDVGLSEIIDVARRAGVTSPLEPVPSLTLGAFELTPLEVVKAYSTIARFGNKQNLAFIKRIESINEQLLYEHEKMPEQVFAPEVVSELIGMMKQTLISGTGRSAQAYGFRVPAAGKTGTTSDTKDAWFSGFTPDTLTVTWVGFDDNTPHGLTGASGALPIWLYYMIPFVKNYVDKDFTWPEGTTKYHLEGNSLTKLISEPNETEAQGVELIFRSGYEP